MILIILYSPPSPVIGFGYWIFSPFRKSAIFRSKIFSNLPLQSNYLSLDWATVQPSLLNSCVANIPLKGAGLISYFQIYCFLTIPVPPCMMSYDIMLIDWPLTPFPLILNLTFEMVFTPQKPIVWYFRYPAISSH